MPRRRKQHPFGTQFDEKRTKEGRGDIKVFLDNYTNTHIEAESTHYDHLLAIARDSDKPFPIKYLNPKLKETAFPRGKTYFGFVFDQIEKVLINYPELRWWMEADGLFVDDAPPELESLSHFDRIVGPLSVQLLQNGRLSRDAVNSIAQTIDANGFTLKERLQPKEWEEVVAHNRRRTGNKIVTFTKAANSPALHELVCHTIYRARKNYKKAFRLLS